MFQHPKGSKKTVTPQGYFTNTVQMPMENNRLSLEYTIQKDYSSAHKRGKNG
jgi:hypothetical protein